MGSSYLPYLETRYMHWHIYIEDAKTVLNSPVYVWPNAISLQQPVSRIQVLFLSRLTSQALCDSTLFVTGSGLVRRSGLTLSA